MTERARLTIVVALTCLLLAAISVAGIALNTGAPATAAAASAQITSHVAPAPSGPSHHDYD